MKIHDFSGGACLSLILGTVFIYAVPAALAVTPDQITGLKLWLDASQGVTSDGTTPAVDGNTVQQWNDRSTGGLNATQPTAGSRPTYKTNILNGHPVLRFNGTHSMVTPSFFDASFNTSITFFIVVEKANTSIEVTTSNQGVTWYSGGTADLIINTANLTPGDITRTPPGTAVITDPTIQSYRYNGSQAVERWNGFYKHAGATGNLGLAGSLTIGSLSSGAFFLHGDIAELIVYNAALTTLQMQQIEEYLMAKYAITSRAASLYAFEGDSMTAGVGSTGGQTYPFQAETLLGIPGYFLNSGVAGETVAQMTANAATQIDSELAYQNTGIPNILMFMGGTNDLFTGVDATTTYNRIVSYAQARRTAGFEVIVSTILPRSEVSTPASFEVSRQTVNALIRANWASFADGLSDIASDTRIGDAGDELNTTYYADKVHMTNAGYGIVASYAVAAINQVIDPNVVSNIVVTPLTTTASISWTTNQGGSTKVNYGLTTGYGSSTAETDTAIRVFTHHVDLADLTACTTYHFLAISNDSFANQAATTDQTFTTLGCATPTPTPTPTATPTPSSGGGGGGGSSGGGNLATPSPSVSIAPTLTPFTTVSVRPVVGTPGPTVSRSPIPVPSWIPPFIAPVVEPLFASRGAAITFWLTVLVILTALSYFMTIRLKRTKKF